MHLQCSSFYRWSQKYGHVPSTRYHLVSCRQLSVFTSGITQCIFRRYLSVSFRRTYYGHILSVPSRSSSFMDVDSANIKIHANRCIHGLGHVIGSCKAINLFSSQVHLHGPRCRIGCELHCFASFVHIELLSSCQNNCLLSCNVSSNIHHSLLLRIRHDSKWSCFSSLESIQVVMYCR